MSTERSRPVTVLVVAPHPDDESLGCGGTLLRHLAQGDVVHWLIVTNMSTASGFAADAVERRQVEITQVAQAYGFAGVDNLQLPPAQLDTLPKGELVRAIGAVIAKVAPQIVYVPFRGDAHSDHGIVFDAVAACTKWFRHPSIRRVLSYETLSETDSALQVQATAFA